MKLQSALLSALVLGLSLEMQTSCKKETVKTNQPEKKPVKGATDPTPVSPESCPACGMG